MEAMRTRWPDERIDDLKFTLDRLESRFDDLQRTMIIGFFALATMFVTGFGTMITLFFATRG